ncbi:dendritic cell-specific transmembrane protein [Mauremys reevesii]|uniref:dendritic cell-specific transmembrane protein n=1 Tax=Mauremys reevesii TaxID=260615 RepID=UPI00193F7AD4|nr:dendritic cell-specific transmembrane protein [Mauremys reevesii]XP_039377075.1 dendritic cell-specific transmembrane protein [Mauremys reevesii]
MSHQWITNLQKKMRIFASITRYIWGLFASERKPGWKNLLQLFAVCSTVSFIISGFLFLGLKSFLAHYPLVSLAISGSTWIGLSTGLCSSKHMRCFGTLFVLSCSLREGRNALIAAGTGVVVAGNIQSIFHNLKILADSIACNLEIEQFSFIKDYMKIIQWIYNEAKHLSIPVEELASLSDKFNVSYLISDEDLKMKLNNTKQQILSVTNHISSIPPYINQGLLPIIGILLVPLGTYLFFRKFLGTHGVKFKNIYITKQFIEFDEHQKQQQKPCVLPLNKKERKKYVIGPSLCLTHKERKSIGRVLIPVFTNPCIWVLFSAVDYLLYWLILSVSKNLQALPELEVNLKVKYQKNENMFIFNKGERKTTNVSFNSSLFKHECLPKPDFSLSSTWLQLGCIIFCLIIFALFSTSLTKLKILVSTSFYPNIEMERIRYLHKKILRKRSKISQKNVKRKWNSFATKFHFWFPVFKAMGMVRKKEKDMININNV